MLLGRPLLTQFSFDSGLEGFAFACFGGALFGTSGQHNLVPSGSTNRYLDFSKTNGSGRTSTITDKNQGKRKRTNEFVQTLGPPGEGLGEGEAYQLVTPDSRGRGVFLVSRPSEVEAHG